MRKSARWCLFCSPVVFALMVAPLTAQSRDGVRLRAGAAISNALPFSALAAGPLAGIDAAYWPGDRWGLEGGLSAIIFPFWTNGDADLTCPDTGTLDAGGCGSRVLSPGRLITARGGLLFQADPLTTVSLSAGRTAWSGPWHQPGNPHRSTWEYSAGVRMIMTGESPRNPAIELRVTRYDRALGEVRWTFGSAIVLRL
ncbi:MAG: hypothetical protein KJZ47_07375 [Gemmatimonadales bacterium]|nr:hypothetical protein [Gemmatimonadales bacterium]